MLLLTVQKAQKVQMILMRAARVESELRPIQSLVAGRGLAVVRL